MIPALGDSVERRRDFRNEFSAEAVALFLVSVDIESSLALRPGLFERRRDALVQ
jgi:hypothetical protein